MSTKTPRVPDWQLERLALGDLSPAEAADVRARLAAEPGGPERLAALLADTEATLRRHPPRAVAAEIQQRLAARQAAARTRWVAAGLLPAMAAAGALLLVGPQRPLGPEPFEAFASERAKGPLLPGLAIHRQVAAAAEQLEVGAPVRAGDLLQLTCVPRGASHGVVVSVDGRGAVTLHFPDRPGGGTALPAGLPSVPLPHAYELDDAPAFERFFLVTAHRPLDAAAVVRAAEAVARGTAPQEAPLALPPDVAQTDFLVRKAQ